MTDKCIGVRLFTVRFGVFVGFCAVCDEAISAFVGGCVSMGKKYHVSCLVCCQCGKESRESEERREATESASAKACACARAHVCVRVSGCESVCECA